MFEVNEIWNIMEEMAGFEHLPSMAPKLLENWSFADQLEFWSIIEQHELIEQHIFEAQGT